MIARWTNSRWIQRLRRNRSAIAALFLLLLLTVFVLIGPYLSPYAESTQNLDRSYGHPTREHWFGLDGLGRDLLTRVIYGGRVSLAVGVVGAVLSILIGVTVGSVAAMAGGWIEQVIMRLIDFLYGVPLLLVVIALMVLLEGRTRLGWLGGIVSPGLAKVFIALGLLYWLGMARVVWSRVAELRSREFVDAARALGASNRAIFFRHLLPNTTGVVVVTATFMIPNAIFAESFLSFLGLGVAVPHASWGTLAAEGLQAMRSHPHILAFPSLAICLTMFAFQAVGEGLRSALDPREAELD